MNAVRRVSIYLLTTVALTLVSQVAFGWGFWAHSTINSHAVALLPEPLREFYEAHIDYVTAHAVDPDMRRGKWKNEGNYHYMDMDDYGSYPNFKVPRTYQEAVKKYGEDTVVKDGMVPWRVGLDVDSLSAAMKVHDTSLVLHLSADLGHYVADMHVPLHATKNYDGQFTGNIGVHYRWESGLPDRYGKDYSFNGIGSAYYIKHPVEHALEILTHSYSLLERIFRADSLAKAGISKDELYKVETKDGRKEYIYSDKYYEKFNTELNGMVEAQMRAATEAVASYWYTAWVNAGKPKFW
ncbi:MAG: S1/P1 Nuclease [Bacteroidetes bacterium]|nr:S1/P1 Nuclease [Bacteroidota bacterium]